MFYELNTSNLVEVCGGTSYGTKYDLEGACSYCGTGARPIGPRFYGSLINTKHRVFITLDGEFLLDMKLSQALFDKGMNSLEKVFYKKNKQMNFMELRSNYELPPFSPKTTGIEKEDECPHCHRNGFFGIPHVPAKFVYESLPEDLLEKNVLITYERFGLSALRKPFEDSGFASPSFIVSELVKDIFEEEKIKNVTFEPITILNS